mmetsp:Transcript_1694/g.2575  ORF Transcript_1694/g.2575 Transcript_1694/m.2575 type:complete len:167 (+) Transcript_1694:44-544(+)
MNTSKSLVLALILSHAANAFVAPSTSAVAFSKIVSPAAAATQMNMVPVDMDTVANLMNSAPSMMLSESEPWVKPLSQVLGPFLNIFSFAMLCRVVISWYPKSNLNEFPYNVAVWPTEPLLRAIRGTVPPAFGVDITPIVWLAIFTFLNEILVGQQGLLTMKMKYGI